MAEPATSTHTVELVKIKTSEAVHKRKPIKLHTYSVRLDGKEAGRVERAMLTRERRTPGRRYVDARWTSPGWRYCEDRGDGRGLGSYWETWSRAEGILRILRDAGLSWDEADRLEHTVRGMR